MQIFTVNRPDGDFALNGSVKTSRETMAALRASDAASWMEDDDKKAVALLAKQVKPNSVIIETGTAFGGSAKILHENLPLGCHLYCIDPLWNSHDSLDALRWLSNDVYELCDLKSYGSALEFTKQYLGDPDNVTFVAAESPYGITDQCPPLVDMVFEDSSHQHPQLDDNLDFWWQRLRPGGILSGHDFGWYDAHVMRAVTNLARREQCQLAVLGSVFWICKPFE